MSTVSEHKTLRQWLPIAAMAIAIGALPNSAFAAKIIYNDALLGAGGTAGAVVVDNFPVLTTWGTFRCTAVLTNCPGSGIAGDPFPLGVAGADYSIVGVIKELLVPGPPTTPVGTIQMYVSNVTITANPANGGNVTGSIDFLSDLIFPVTLPALPAGIFLRGSFVGAGGGAPNAADSLSATMVFSPNGIALDPTVLTDTTAGVAPFTLSDVGILGGSVAELAADLTFTLAPGDSIRLPGSVEVEDDGYLGEETPEPATIGLMGGALCALGLGLRRKRRS